MKTIAGLPTDGRRIARIRQALVGWIYPPLCAACEAPLTAARQIEVPFLCEPCEAALTPIGDHYCRVCGQGFDGTSALPSRCGNCGDRELAIVRAQVPEASEQLTAQVAKFVDRLRRSPFGNAFQRAPGIAESVEWAKALVALDTLVIDPEVVADTAGILFKQREDVAALTHQLAVELLRPDEASDTDKAA